MVFCLEADFDLTDPEEGESIASAFFGWTQLMEQYYTAERSIEDRPKKTAAAGKSGTHGKYGLSLT